MIIASDLRSKQGTVLCVKGQEVTRALRFRLRNYSMNSGLEGSIEVLMAVDVESPDRVAEGPRYGAGAAAT